jgi:CHAT domain-containing protein
MSLWPVADEGAHEWMVDLYEARFSRKLDTATAVRDASRMTLERRRARGASTHPWHWAGFIAAGDWR